MSLWQILDACGVSEPEIQAGQTLLGSASSYLVLEFIGEGCYGKVAKCQNLDTKETVAVKILTNDSDIQDTEREVSILKAISVLNPDLTNVVKFFELFDCMGQTCLVFEMLDRTVYDLLEERDWKPLSVNEIRPIAKQMLVALDALKGLGILHTDIKPDNIMFVSVQEQPLRVKLIDFGEAIPTSKVQPKLGIQPVGYRAPEVALGLPFTEAIDVWGMGCVLAFLYLAENLFPVDCDYQMMKCMVEVLGQPENHMLRAGKYTKCFFCEEKADDDLWSWRLMTPEEYTEANCVKSEERNSAIELPSSLDDLVYVYPKLDTTECEDRTTFVDLLKLMLHLDGDQRISPREALQHSFITMSHLTENPDSRDYLTISQILMSICSMENSTASTPHQQSADDFYVGSLDPGSSDDTPTTVCYDDRTAGASCSSDGSLHSCSYDEDRAARLSDGVNTTDLTAPSASFAATKLRKRISRFFHQISDAFICFWRPRIEN